jgi:superfamily I DNA/RNA helicase
MSDASADHPSPPWDDSDPEIAALLEGLNAEQREAVTATEGPVLILAGPGSGKTRVITHRIAFLIRARGARPWNILAVTFTNKAAREMKDRLEALVGPAARDLNVGTFHSICSRVLRHDIELLDFGRTRNFTILDDGDQLALVKEAVQALNLNEKQYQPRVIREIISRAKNNLQTPRQFAESVSKYMDEIAARVYARYDEDLRRQNSVDFDDLILLTQQLWRRAPDALSRAQDRYRYIHVDEFQDCNHAQYELVRLLAAGTPDLPGRHHICVVGDEDQCLVAGTAITMADGSQKPIEDIKTGDMVLSAYGSGDFRAARVQAATRRDPPGAGISITTCSGRTLTSTPEHTHFAGYPAKNATEISKSSLPPLAQAASVRPGMVMLDAEGGYDIVERVEMIPLDAPVYDLDIEGTHNFIANGTVTHNSIYAWRGASSKNILEFESDFPEHRSIILARNYRSTQNILDAAMQIVRQNPNRHDKPLWTDHGAGVQIVVHEAYNEEAEGQFVVNSVRTLVGREQAKLSDFAVLYRTNAQSRAIEEQFIRAGVPYIVIGSRKFYERKEIRDIIAYLRLIYNPHDIPSLRRIINVPARKIGEMTVKELLVWAAQQNLTPDEAIARIDSHPTLGAGPRAALQRFGQVMADLRALAGQQTPDKLIDEILLRTGYASEIRDGTEEGEERWRNILELRRVAEDYSEIDPESALPLMLEQVALIGGADTAHTSGDDRASLVSQPRDAVTLITLHAAKGLEFPVVFLVGMEEGVLPHARSMESAAELEEERRLTYVGVTRAMRRLYLVHVFKRSFYGGNAVLQMPSRFLGDIAPGLLSVAHDEGRQRPAGHAPSLSPGRRRSSPSASRTSEPAPFVPRSQRATGRRSEIASFPSAAPSSESSASPEPPAAAPAPPQRDPRPGDTVRHRIFGKGVVVKVIAERDATTVEVLFEKSGRKELDLSFANLEIVGE